MSVYGGKCLQQFDLRELLEETYRKNQSLIEILVQKDMDISNLRSEVYVLRYENQSMCKQIKSMDNKSICTNTNDYKVYLEAETKSKFQNNTPVLKEILRNQRSLVEKIGIGFNQKEEYICDSVGMTNAKQIKYED